MSMSNLARDIGYELAITRTATGNYLIYLHPDIPCREFSNLEEIIANIQIMKKIILKEKPDYVNMPDDDIKRLEKARLKIVGNGRKLISR